jgi:hypothetical protein
LLKMFFTEFHDISTQQFEPACRLVGTFIYTTFLVLFCASISLLLHISWSVKFEIYIGCWRFLQRHFDHKLDVEDWYGNIDQHSLYIFPCEEGHT